MAWKNETKELISHYQELGRYTKYADLDEFLQWLGAEGHAEIADRIRGNENHKQWCAKELIKWRKDNVSPWILFTYARDFLSSGNGILEQHASNQRGIPGIVVYFLFGRSIELYLKAFLVARGSTAGLIREVYGHDLMQLLNESRRRKLGQFVQLSRNEIRALELLNISYSDKQFEYPVLGGQVRPDHALIRGAASKLEAGLRNYCRRVTSERWAGSRITRRSIDAG